MRSDRTNIPVKSVEQLMEICINGFKNDFKGSNGENIPVYLCDDKISINSEIMMSMESLMSDQWKYFNGPKFKVNFENINISVSVEKGIIVESNKKQVEGMSFIDFVFSNILKKSEYKI